MGSTAGSSRGGSYSTAGTSTGSSFDGQYRREALRVPDGERRCELTIPARQHLGLTSTSAASDSRDSISRISRHSSSGHRSSIVSVVNHNKRRDDKDEPRSSDARPSEYQKSSKSSRHSSSHRPSR